MCNSCVDAYLKLNIQDIYCMLYYTSIYEVTVEFMLRIERRLVDVDIAFR